MTMLATQGPCALSALPMMTNAQQLFAASARLQAHAFKAMMQFQIESLSFLKHRFEEDVKLVEKMTKSNDIGDAIDLWKSFFSDATSEYAEETQKFARIGSQVASDTAQQVKKEAEVTLRDMTERTAA